MSRALASRSGHPCTSSLPGCKNVIQGHCWNKFFQECEESNAGEHCCNNVKEVTAGSRCCSNELGSHYYNNNFRDRSFICDSHGRPADANARDMTKNPFRICVLERVHLSHFVACYNCRDSCGEEKRKKDKNRSILKHFHHRCHIVFFKKKTASIHARPAVSSMPVILS